MYKEKMYVAKNGIKVYAYPNPALHGFHISLFVRGGSMYETERESGITHFLEHATIRNVNKLYGMKLYSLLDKMGLEFNASTFSEMVQFYVSGSSPSFKAGAEMISKALMPIELERAELDAERKRIKAEIRESDETGSLTAFSAKQVFGGTSLAQSIVGTNRAIDGISLRKLASHQKKLLSPKNIFFYVTGAFDESDIEALLSFIGSARLESDTEYKNEAPVPEKFGKRDSSVFVKRDDYTMARFTFDLDMGKYSVAETDLLYDTLLSGYNSKLFMELSEGRGLVYDVTGGSERYRNIGTLSFSYEVKSTDLAESIRLVVDILNSLKREENIECIKAGYVDNAYMLYDDIRELNFTFAYDNHIMEQGYTSVEDRKKRYECITEKRLAEMAGEIFTPNNVTLALKSPNRSLDTEAIREALGKLKAE